MTDAIRAAIWHRSGCVDREFAVVGVEARTHRLAVSTAVPRLRTMSTFFFSISSTINRGTSDLHVSDEVKYGVKWTFSVFVVLLCFVFVVFVLFLVRLFPIACRFPYE